MPLTFCHPAIVLPLKKLKPTWFSMTGLIIGSMSPDLEYFSRMEILATHSHLFWGVLYFDLPIALIYCFVFHLFVRNIVIIHLPYFFQERFVDFLNFDWINYFKKQWLVVIISIIIGAYSHLFWDAFTHEWGYFAKLIPALQEVWFTKPIEVKGYKFLQHFSTFLGAIFIAFWIYKMPKQTLPITKFDYSFWLKIILLTTIISMLRFVLFPVEIGLGNIIVVVGMSGFLSLVGLGMIDKNKKKSVLS
ncbi:DUF4184 family protein [Algoriella sp.]|uniref:DUF4184 family protein n=1 Tax=Algoriella sp. TaxID=1872434 RepID=UPI002FCA6F82